MNFGNSQQNTKCVVGPPGLHCRKDSGDPHKRVNPDHSNAPDKFDVYHVDHGGKVCAKRLDYSGGWGMNLQIACQPLTANTCGICTFTDGVLAPTIVGTDNGREYTCQEAENFMKANFDTTCWGAPDPWPSTCCQGCNLCPAPGDVLSPATIAGTHDGNQYTCQQAWDSLQLPSNAIPCATAQLYWGPTCCVTV